MIRRSLLGLLAVSLLAAGCGGAPTAVGTPGLKSTMSRPEQKARAKSIISNHQALYAKHQILVQASGMTEGNLPIKGAKVTESFQGYQVHELPANVSLDQALDAYYADGRVASAQPLVLHTTSEQPVTDPTAPVVPSLGTVTNDPDLFQQYWLDKVKAPQAWELTKGNPEVVVAVLDTGVDYTHPDLKGQVVNAPDFGANDEDSLDEGGHGTHVAGIIAAAGNNGEGGSGIAPDCKVMAVKVFKPFYDNGQYLGFYADDLDIARGIYYAATHGAKIINMSLGGHGIAPVIQSVCDDAAGRGVVVLAAAGNDHENDLSDLSPAGVASVIPVVATDATDRISSFSNFGRMDALSAPGASIYSTVPSYQPKYGHKGPLNYNYLDGTSMACPVTAGATALVTSYMLTQVRDFFASRQIDLKVSPMDLPADEIANALRYSAVDLGAWDRDPVYGYGRINVAAARKKLQDKEVVRGIANKVYRKLLSDS
ncbi:MAG TPA: S8 family serine peptidase [Stenomitos sp.]